ncbi:hypothetical protein Tco_0121342, partial [Tanacetum coccineum]
RQKSYADRRLKPLEFEVGDMVLLKIVARVGHVAYTLELPEELKGIHSTFHVLNLKKCLAEGDVVVPMEEIQLDDKLHMIKELVEIVDKEVSIIHCSSIVKKSFIVIIDLSRERHGPDNLDNLRKLFEKQAPGAVVKAQLSDAKPSFSDISKAKACMLAKAKSSDASSNAKVQACGSKAKLQTSGLKTRQRGKQRCHMEADHVLVKDQKIIMLSSDISYDRKGPSKESVPIFEEPSVQGLLDWYGYNNIKEYLSWSYFSSTYKDITDKDCIHESNYAMSKANVTTWDENVSKIEVRKSKICTDKAKGKRKVSYGSEEIKSPVPDVCCKQTFAGYICKQAFAACICCLHWQVAFATCICIFHLKVAFASKHLRLAFASYIGNLHLKVAYRATSTCSIQTYLFACNCNN